MHPQFYSIFYQKEKLLSYDMVWMNFYWKNIENGVKVKEYEKWLLNVIVDQEYWGKRALKKQEFTSRIFAILRYFFVEGGEKKFFFIFFWDEWNNKKGEKRRSMII